VVVVAMMGASVGAGPSSVCTGLSEELEVLLLVG
jgi:hypothetical protein